MLTRPITPVVLTFIVGVLYNLYTGHHKDESNVVGQIAFLVGGGLAYMAFVTILPLLVSLVLFAKNKVFPARFFTRFCFIMLALLTLLLVVGNLA
jgi:hypothetical protein